MAHKENAQTLSADEVREAVRENYGQVAQWAASAGGCCGTTSSCCGPVKENAGASADEVSAEFRLGEIENLPVADDSVDVIISNCVINLSPEKERVFREAYRVLRNGGRLAISDVVATAELPEDVRRDLSLYTGCISGAASVDEIRAMLEGVGFTDIAINPKDESRDFIREWVPGRSIEDYVLSATIEATKPTR